MCNSVREEPLSSSWETWAETRATQRPAPVAASHTGLLSNEGCLTESSHLRRPLSPWGSWRALDQLSGALQRGPLSSGSAGDPDTCEVRGWTELSLMWPLPFASCVISGNLLEPQFSHCPVESAIKPPKGAFFLFISATIHHRIFNGKKDFSPATQMGVLPLPILFVTSQFIRKKDPLT